MGGHFVKSSASGPIPTSRYCDHMSRAIEHVLDAGRLRRAGLDAAEIGPDDGLDLAPDAIGQRGIAPRALFDDALEQARDEGHPARLHGLQVARGEEPGARRVAMPFHAVGDDVIEAARATARP